jgi:acetylornithine deacetylase/succinyl-diaminopimelate desuccinylase family protein
MLDEATVRACVDAVDEEEVLAFAHRLIAAPSENPPGDEREVAAVAGDILASLDADPRTVERERGRPNVLGRLGSGGRTLAWNGHLDVVPAGDLSTWTHPPFAAKVDGGRLIGRGSADMKGGVAAALAAGAAIRAAGVELGGTLEYHLVADEELLGIHGTRVLRDEGLIDVDACVVGEPTSLRLALAERGGAWLVATAQGKSAHGSRPELGVNAITSISRVVLQIGSVLPDLTHPLVGSPSVNVSLISGGSAPNVVPDRAEITIDRRTIPGETEESVRAPFDELLRRLREEHPDCDIVLEQREWTEPSETPEGAEIEAVAGDAVREVLGSEPVRMGLSGITDARYYLNDAAVPALILGPGALEVAHTANEAVEVSELLTAARVYAALFVRYLGA